METSFVLTDPRFALMSGDEVKIYCFLWATAVHERRETPKSIRDIEFLANRVQIHTESVTKALRKLSKSPLTLIRLRCGGEGKYTITIIGVREKHQQLEWKARPVPSPNGDDSGRRVEVEIEKSKSTPYTSPHGGDSPFDSLVLPFWRECEAKGWLKGFKEGSEEFENARKRINRAWPGKHGIGAVWGDFKRELPTARFVTETWKPGFVLLTRRNSAGTLHRVCVAKGEYKHPVATGKVKPQALQVGDEYDNIAKVVNTNGDEGTPNENG